MTEVEAVLADGPFAGERAIIDAPEPEHLRVWLCRDCRDSHWCDEAEDWPRGAIRYALATSADGDTEAIYVHDGAPEGGRPVAEHEYAPEEVMA